MDLNYLFSRHQLSLLRATSAATPEARCAHRGLADGYAARIGDLQRRAGAAAAPLAAAA